MKNEKIRIFAAIMDISQYTNEAVELLQRLIATPSVSRDEAAAADILAEGKTNRCVCYREGQFMDMDITEALAMQKTINPYQFEVSKLLSRNEYTENKKK